MSDDALFERPGWRGPMRQAFDAAFDGAGDTLVLLGRMQADRLDVMRAANAYRGLVPLSAEFRATLRDLREAGTGDTDPLERLIAEFRAADGAGALDPTADGHGAHPGPAH